jgi:hypothetical protein
MGTEKENAEVINTGEVNKSNNSDTIKSTVQKGISFGTCLAMIISYTAWKSIPWAIIHGLMSWIYVFYYWAEYINN